MKIVIIGGHGRIGSKVGKLLRAVGYDAVAADLGTGIDTLTGQGLDEALDGADVVVDVSNSPAFDEASATSFFETATRNVLAAENGAGVRHHAALSVVGLPGATHLKQRGTSVLDRQCFDRRIDNAAQLVSETSKWEADRNQKGNANHLALHRFRRST
jgi:nucleoside-diphosphate-sugar epimerase